MSLPRAVSLWVFGMAIVTFAAAPMLSATPTATPTALTATQSHSRDRLIGAAHLLRRLGFGPKRSEISRVLRMGESAYLEEQLRPEQIDDGAAESKFYPEPVASEDYNGWLYRWYTRMVYSRRQLQEKMALIWHEHFATSLGKVGSIAMARDQEEFLRRNGLGSFRTLLIGITRDSAMLVYLDNSYNNGNAFDDEGSRIPPNENYAREMLQLFALGTLQRNLDGTPVENDLGEFVPAYSETDVKEVARALTGWAASYPQTEPHDPQEYLPPAQFYPDLHDSGPKAVLGMSIAETGPEAGRRDVNAVVDILMAQPTMAPFISKILIQKLASETPSSDYVRRVATVFRDTHGSIRDVVRAIFTDPEFVTTIATQYKEPIEHLVQAVRALDGTSQGRTLYYWTLQTGQLIYNPPSVFSFYRPGQKETLVNAAYAVTRDQATDMIANGYVDDFFDTTWDADRMIRRYRLQGRPERAVDRLTERLLGYRALRPEVREVIVDYMGGTVTAEKLRGAAWLILCSPDYQVN